MAKKEEQKLCPHCDGYIPLDVLHCPYCASDVSQSHSNSSLAEEGILDPPYSSKFSVTKEEWNQALEEKKEEKGGESKNELVALLMLIPGVLLTLFALLILFFSKEGVLTLQWKESFAYLYLLGAIPLLILGFRSLR